MSNIHVAGGSKALPFTGLATLPILVIGALISACGFLMTTIRRPKTSRSI